MCCAPTGWGGDLRSRPLKSRLISDSFRAECAQVIIYLNKGEKAPPHLC